MIYITYPICAHHRVLIYLISGAANSHLSPACHTSYRHINDDHIHTFK